MYANLISQFLPIYLIGGAASQFTSLDALLVVPEGFLGIPTWLYIRQMNKLLCLFQLELSNSQHLTLEQ